MKKSAAPAPLEIDLSNLQVLAAPAPKLISGYRLVLTRNRRDEGTNTHKMTNNKWTILYVSAEEKARQN